MSVHLDGVDDVVIIEGEAEILAGADDELAARLATASNAKYPEHRVTPEVCKGRRAIAIRPLRLLTVE